MPLPPESIYPSKEALFEAIQAFAFSHRYAFTIRRSKRLDSGRHKITYYYDRFYTVKSITTRIRKTSSRGTGCIFSIIAIET